MKVAASCVTCLGEPGRCGCDGLAACVDRDPRHARHVEAFGPLLRREVCDRSGHSVVRMLRDDRAVASGDAGRDPPRDVIRLASRIDEHHGVEPGLRRHRGEQALRELDERLVDVTRMRVQRTRLAYDRLCHARMGMADDRHVVVRVEQTPAVDVDEPRPLPARNVDGIGVRELSEQCAERVGASLDQRVCRPPAVAQRRAPARNARSRCRRSARANARSPRPRPGCTRHSRGTARHARR